VGDGSTDIDALVALLTDASRATRRAVRQQLAERGDAADAALERATRSDDARLRARARQARSDLRAAAGMASLEALLRSGEPDLVRGMLAIDTALGNDVEGVEERLAALADRLEARVPRGTRSTQAAEALRAVLHGEAGLVGPEEDFHNVEHISVARALDTGRGIPLTLCAIYAAVARAAGFEAAILPFPGHVLLGLGPASDRVILDPFSGGDPVSREACLVRLTAMGAPPSPRWLSPAPDREMIIRQVRNLGAAMARHGRAREARRALALADDASA